MNAHNMQLNRHFKLAVLTVGIATLLTACGGGGGSSGSNATTTTPITQTTTPATTTPAPVVLPANPITTEVTQPVTPVTDTPAVAPSSIAQSALETLNAKRIQCGFGALTYNTELEKAATNHANYLGYVSSQNKLTYGSHTEGNVTGLVGTGTDNPYYSGYSVSNRIKTDTSKGQSAQVVSYDAAMAAENLSMATLTTVNNTVDPASASQSMLTSLLAAPYHMRGLVSPNLTQIGINYNQVEWQNTTNKDIMSVIELVSALPAGQTTVTNTSLLTYPCEGITATEYELTDESPNPMVNRNLQQNPVGQPIYILAPTDKSILSVEATIAKQGVSAGNLTILTQYNDPNKLLKANEAFLIPETKLDAATTYTVNYTVTYNTGDQVTKSFNFSTKA